MNLKKAADFTIEIADSPKKKEVTTEHVKTYKSTQNRLRKMAMDNDCSMAEVVDRLSKTGSAKSMYVRSPKEYFVTRNGLYVWGDFISRVVSKIGSEQISSSFKLRGFDLKESSTDAQIEKSLPKNHLFSESDICAIIIGMIEKQRTGGKGMLLNNGYANLFYLKGCVVSVGWDSGRRYWRVGAWLRGDDRWADGGRVFSPAS